MLFVWTNRDEYFVRATTTSFSSSARLSFSCFIACSKPTKNSSIMVSLFFISEYCEERSELSCSKAYERFLAYISLKYIFWVTKTCEVWAMEFCKVTMFCFSLCVCASIAASSVLWDFTAAKSASLCCSGDCLLRSSSARESRFNFKSCSRLFNLNDSWWICWE